MALMHNLIFVLTVWNEVVTWLGTNHILTYVLTVCSESTQLICVINHHWCCTVVIVLSWPLNFCRFAFVSSVLIIDLIHYVVIRVISDKTIPQIYSQYKTREKKQYHAPV